MIRLGRLAALGLAVPVVLAACTSPDRPAVVPDEVVLPTPMRSFDVSIERALSALDAALAGSGERLEVPASAYRPSEPESLLQTPRVLRRVALADPDDGFVVIYETPSRGAALEAGQQLADYLASGFGQTNYVADTQFAVSTLEDTVIFTTWSQRRSDDPERAEAAFDAIGSVGDPIDVEK